MNTVRIYALAILILGGLTGWFLTGDQSASKFPYRLGLDLRGGTHLVYKADITNLQPEDVQESLAALRDTIERRVNVFGVAEPLVQVERASSLVGSGEQRLIVELPGVTDTQKAVDMIGKTPVLDFRLAKTTTVDGKSETAFIPTQLTGRFLSGASLSFGAQQGGVNEPVVNLKFNSEGSELFAKLTKENIGQVLAIFLDGQPISTPVIQDEIIGGEAVISGRFTAQEGKELVRSLNLGALPVPIELLSTNTVGSTLGADAVARGVSASLWGFAFVALFLLAWYRLPGLVAVLALALYVALMLAAFKLIPVTITAAGIAALILSMGMAVDANVLIFERMKEELRKGKHTAEAVREGAARAWGAIRDGNLTSIISAIILFWFGTSMVKGFALVFLIGVLASMFTAIVVTRTLMLVLGNRPYDGWVKWLYGTGITNK